MLSQWRPEGCRSSQLSQVPDTLRSGYVLPAWLQHPAELLCSAFINIVIILLVLLHCMPAGFADNVESLAAVL